MKKLYNERHLPPRPPSPPRITITMGLWMYKFSTRNIKLDSGVVPRGNTFRPGLQSITFELPDDEDHLELLNMLNSDSDQRYVLSVAMHSGSEFEYRDCLFLYSNEDGITFQTFNRHAITPEVSGGWSVE